MQELKGGGKKEKWNHREWRLGERMSFSPSPKCSGFFSLKTRAAHQLQQELQHPVQPFYRAPAEVLKSSQVQILHLFKVVQPSLQKSQNEFEKICEQNYSLSPEASSHSGQTHASIKSARKHQPFLTFKTLGNGFQRYVASEHRSSS